MTVMKTVAMTMCNSFCHPKYKKSKLMMKIVMKMTEMTKMMMMMSMVVPMMMMMMMTMPMMMTMLMMMSRVVVAMYINSVVALQGLLLSLFHSFSTVAHFSQL